MSNYPTSTYGANPISIKWNVVRGDTATLDIDFLQANETTAYNTSAWTLNWGGSYKNIVAELPFDLQVVIEAGSGAGEDTVWTPIVGTIVVIGDVSPGGSL